MQKPLSFFRGGGGGGTPYDGPYGEAPLESGTFSRLQVYESEGKDFTSWSIWKDGEICHLGLWKSPKGPTDEFYGFIKSPRKRSIFVIDSYLNGNAYTAVKRDAMF